MRAVSLVLLAALTVAAFAAVDPANPAGNWKRPTIENMTVNPQYTENHILYGVYSNITRTWSSLGWEQAPGTGPVVQVRRNRDVQAWDYIHFNSFNATDGYYTVGYAEGYLTYDTIYYTFVNQVKANADALSKNTAAQAFLADHIRYEQHHEKKTAFGKQLANQLRQVDGIYAGYVAGYIAAGRPTNITQLSWQDIYLVSYMEELDNVLSKYSLRGSPRLSQKQKILNNPALHCSALMKLTSDDLFFAHDTWSGFNTMLRQYKTYEMAEGTVVMSGYPGSISSIDDWYMTSKDLAVTETTNGFWNNNLYDYIRPNQVSEFNRVMIGNFIAETPLEWMNIFNTSNSGTYNNQYMVANMAVARAAIRQGQPLPLGTFYVGEQIPGTIVFEDQTPFLNTNKHWPSFNIPYYRKIQILSGYDALQAPQYFGMENYETYSRSVIFRRMQGDVTDLASMFYMMRYNNWEQDPASTLHWCKTSWNPNGTYNCGNNTQGSAQTIASRYDLNTPQPSPDGDYVGTQRVPFGAIDTKVTSAMMMEGGAFRAVAINGPTRVQQPAWDYKSFIRRFPEWSLKPYVGMPSLYDFSPVHFSGDGPNTPAPFAPAPEDDDDNKKRNIAIGVGVAAGVCVVGVGAVLFFRMRRSSGGEYDEGRALV
eukprot:CAMPEP_0174883008 /NCGR_PEP_ID=MMETSP1114-20130205/85050_1 /TAXON_ID=312471 /ORGANISM="Neobodo designis, Strain CCAP 1951/1" /LENGTH=649 /DNA_ID=CAMNT_0016118409 /DNA_START=46 /DNA_END=1995 /DNA_ORIENTATION=+